MDLKPGTIKNADVIIVGQGLAGSVLALKFMALNKRVMVIDKAGKSNCSKIAAGIWNPIVFKRLTKSWMADELLPVMLKFYKEQERQLNCQMITERAIVKFFTEQQESILWQKKAQGELQKFLDPQIRTQRYNEHVPQTESGFSKVIGAGNLDVKKFLDQTRDYLLAADGYSDELFDHGQLGVGDRFTYRDMEAPVIIFAEGHLVKYNPYFNYIPLKPAKGEMITVEAEDLHTGTDIINKNGFLLPSGAGSYKTGATYNWEDLTDHPTTQGRRELEKKLRHMVTGVYEVTDHRAGVRPSVIDRRPVLGAHPEHKNMYVFNGMGTKGVMLAPFFAGQLIDHMYNQTPLSPEVNAARFDPLRKFLPDQLL